MKTAGEILKSKGKQVYSVPPTYTVHEALKEMSEKNIGAILVMEDNKVLGIFSERDYARRVVLKGKTELTRVREVMTKEIFFVHPEQTTEECLAQMTDKHIRHLPVMEDNKLVGVLSIGDLVKTTIKYQKGLIRDLESYIMGGGRI